MFQLDRNAMKAASGPAREAFEAWISFFPTAPLFGVQWRFAPDFDPLGLVKNKPEAKPASAPAGSRPTKVAPDPVHGASVDPAPTPKPTPKPTPATAQKAAKMAEPTVAEPAQVAPKPVKAKPTTSQPKAKSAKKPVKKATDRLATLSIDGGSILQIKGIGEKLAAELVGMGIATIADLAVLSKSQLAQVDAKLTTIKGRCYRDDWVGQAKMILKAANQKAG